MSEAIGTNEKLLDEIERLRLRIDQLEAADSSRVIRSPPARETTRSERLLKLHIEHSPLGMIEWDRKFRVRQWSRRTEEIFGWSLDEMVGRRWDEIRFVHVDDHEIVDSTCFSLLSSEVDFCTCSNRNYRKDGTIVHCEWFNSVVFGDDGKLISLLSLVHDVTEEVNVRAELEETRAVLAAAIEASPAGIIISDAPDGRIRSVNAAALGILGAEAEELTDITYEQHPTRWQCFHPDGRPFEPQEMPLARAILEGVVSCNVDVIIERSDGSAQWVLGNAAPVRNAEGNIIGGVVVFPDVTEQKTAAAALRKTESELAHVARVSTMGEMVGGIAHELNQPLYAIQNFSKASVTLLEGGGQLDRDQLTDWLHQITDAAEHAGKVLVRLRDFVSQRPIKKTAIDISDVIDAAIAMTEHEARQQRVSLVKHLDPSLPLLVADSVQIQQVVVNLVRNGIEAMADTNVDRQIEISVTNADNSVRVCVSDTGKGLPADEHDACFKAFSSTKPNGMGLGLAIAKTIIESHGGKLWAINRSGGGAEFYFTLDATG